MLERSRILHHFPARIFLSHNFIHDNPSFSSSLHKRQLRLQASPFHGKTGIWNDREGVMAEKKTYEELEEHIRKPENQLYEQQSTYNPDMPIRKTLNISDISFEIYSA